MVFARVAIAYLIQRCRDLIWRLILTKHRDSSERTPSLWITSAEYNHSGRIRRRREMRYAGVVANEACREPRNSRDRAKIQIFKHRQLVFAQYLLHRGFRWSQYEYDARTLAQDTSERREFIQRPILSPTSAARKYRD